MQEAFAVINQGCLQSMWFVDFIVMALQVLYRLGCFQIQHQLQMVLGLFQVATKLVLV